MPGDLLSPRLDRLTQKRRQPQVLDQLYGQPLTTETAKVFHPYLLRVDLDVPGRRRAVVKQHRRPIDGLTRCHRRRPRHTPAACVIQITQVSHYSLPGTPRGAMCFNQLPVGIRVTARMFASPQKHSGENTRSLKRKIWALHSILHRASRVERKKYRLQSPRKIFRNETAEFGLRMAISAIYVLQISPMSPSVAKSENPMTRENANRLGHSTP